jgi:hypothetical protein
LLSISSAFLATQPSHGIQQPMLDDRVEPSLEAPLGCRLKPIDATENVNESLLQHIFDTDVPGSFGAEPASYPQLEPIIVSQQQPLESTPIPRGGSRHQG